MFGVYDCIASRLAHYLQVDLGVLNQQEDQVTRTVDSYSRRVTHRLWQTIQAGAHATCRNRRLVGKANKNNEEFKIVLAVVDSGLPTFYVTNRPNGNRTTQYWTSNDEMYIISLCIWKAFKKVEWVGGSRRNLKKEKPFKEFYFLYDFSSSQWVTLLLSPSDMYGITCRSARFHHELCKFLSLCIIRPPYPYCILLSI